MKPADSTGRRLLYIECGTTARLTVHTGIQRVVRSICREMLGIAEIAGVETILVDFTNDQFQVVSAEHLNTPRRTANAPATASRRSLMRRIEQALYSRVRSELYDRLRQGVRTLWRRLRPLPVPYQLQPRDAQGAPAMLLLLDSTWDNAMWNKIDAFRAQGGVVCAVLYDLIPFTHPETVEETTRRAHTGWWSHVPGRVDAVACISQTIQQEYLAWRNASGYPFPVTEHVTHFYLGAELDERDPVIKVLSQHESYFMMVGSIEPRKNHQCVLDAFELLWRRGCHVRLVIVGAFGWKNDAITARIRQHEKLNDRLFFINDASDRDLAALYGKTSGLVIASIAEGFGLPIVEAQLRGVPVICSDIPVFREVARHDAHYFDATAPSSLAAVIYDQITQQHSGAYAPNQANASWISWNTSARDLLAQLLQLTASIHLENTSIK